MSPYSFREAHNSEAFLQFNLIGIDKFGAEAKRRDVSLSFGSELRRRLEHLDQLGALCPIGFQRSEPDDLTYREESAFNEWQEQAIDVHGLVAPRPLYSPWQLLYVKRAVDLGTAPLAVEWIRRHDNGFELPPALVQFYMDQERQRRSLEDQWRAVLLLLTRIQNRYLPAVRGTLTKITTQLSYDPDIGDYIDPYRKEVQEFQPQVVLEELGLTDIALREIHQTLSIHGAREDPLSHFYMLFRMTPHSERGKLSGAALRAQDAYDAAEMLRRFYHDLTGDLLPTSDEFFDLSGGQWKEQLFGRKPRLRYNRDDLRLVLIRHHVYPHSVHLVVEGETDELLFRTLLEALGGPITDLGVTFSTLKGAGRARLYSDILRSAKRYARFPMLAADREGDIEKVLEIMKNEGLLSDETAFLWSRSVEEDNFSDGELVAAAATIAQRKGLSLQLDAATLRKKYDDLHARVGKNIEGLATLLVRLARHPDRGSVVISKVELAHELSRILLNDLESEEDEAILLARRPIFDIVFKIIRVT